MEHIHIIGGILYMLQLKKNMLIECISKKKIWELFLKMIDKIYILNQLLREVNFITKWYVNLIYKLNFTLTEINECYIRITAKIKTRKF